MKPNIHPQWYNATVTCACGETFTTQATQKQIKTEICSNCHPFYTGKQKSFSSREGQVEKFRQRYGLDAEEKQ